MCGWDDWRWQQCSILLCSQSLWTVTRMTVPSMCQGGAGLAARSQPSPFKASVLSRLWQTPLLLAAPPTLPTVFLHHWVFIGPSSLRGFSALWIGPALIPKRVLIQDRNQMYSECQLLSEMGFKLWHLHFYLLLWVIWASLVAQMVKNLLAVQDTQVQSLSPEDPLEKGMVIHFREFHGQTMESQRVGHEWATNTFTFAWIIYFTSEYLFLTIKWSW